MKIKVLIVDMEADSMTATSNMINALAEVLRSAFPPIEETQQEDIHEENKP